MSKRELNKILDKLDDTRETRYAADKANRFRMERQLKGYRHEWYQYTSIECLDNFIQR